MSGRETSIATAGFRSLGLREHFTTEAADGERNCGTSKKHSVFQQMRKAWKKWLVVKSYFETQSSQLPILIAHHSTVAHAT